jgi:hypothetical protein
MSKIKKKSELFLLMGLCIGIALVIFVCSSEAQMKTPKPLKITLSGYSVGGSSTVVAESIGEAIKRAVPGSAFTFEPGQSGANEVVVATGKTELGFSHHYTTKAAMTGKEFFKRAYPNLRAITYMHDTYSTWVFRKDTGLTSIEEIKEKKFPIIAGANMKDSLMEIQCRYGLEAYGISYEDIEKWGGKIHYITSVALFDLMRNKRANAYLMCMTPPFAGLNELSINVELIWLPMSDEAIQTTAKKLGGGKKIFVPKEWYPRFLTSNVPTLAVPNILITRAEIPEETIYWITKAIYDNLGYLHKASVQLSQMTKETMGMELGGVPLHPGAEKFYREAGVPIEGK